MIKRTVIIDLTFACCKDEKYRNIDHTVRITLHQDAEKFTTKLTDWVDIFLLKDKVIDYIYSLGDSKCAVVDPSLKMCRKSPHEPVIGVIDYYQEPPECAEADIAEYIYISDRLIRYNKLIAPLEERRKVLMKKERINKEVDELRKINNELERMFKIESKQINELARLKEKCPGIEEQVEQKRKQK
jgi:hypothetical protein